MNFLQELQSHTLYMINQTANPALVRRKIWQGQTRGINLFLRELEHHEFIYWNHTNKKMVSSFENKRDETAMVG